MTVGAFFAGLIVLITISAWTKPIINFAFDVVYALKQ